MSRRGQSTHHTLDVQRAVCESALPRELRHMVMVYALLADHKTGIGFTRQSKMAAAIGCSDRQLRRALATLDHLADAGTSPVRIARRARSRKEGRGRTSDEYRVELLGQRPTGHERPDSPRDLPDADVLKDDGPNGRGRPGSPRDLPDISTRLTGHPRSDQPDVGVRGRSSQGSSQRSSQSLSREARPPKTAMSPPHRDTPPAKCTRRSQLPPSWAPTPQHVVYAGEQHLDLAHQAAQFRDHHRAKGSLMVDWDAAFRTWLRNSATDFGRGQAKKLAPVQGGDYEVGRPPWEDDAATGGTP